MYVCPCERARRVILLMYYARIREISKTREKKVQEKEYKGKSSEDRKNVVLVEYFFRYFFLASDVFICVRLYIHTHMLQPIETTNASKYPIVHRIENTDCAQYYTLFFFLSFVISQIIDIFLRCVVCSSSFFQFYTRLERITLFFSIYFIA